MWGPRMSVHMFTGRAVPCLTTCTHNTRTFTQVVTLASRWRCRCSTTYPENVQQITYLVATEHDVAQHSTTMCVIVKKEPK